MAYEMGTGSSPRRRYGGNLLGTGEPESIFDVLGAVSQFSTMEEPSIAQRVLEHRGLLGMDTANARKLAELDEYSRAAASISPAMTEEAQYRSEKRSVEDIYAPLARAYRRGGDQSNDFGAMDILDPSRQPKRRDPYQDYRRGERATPGTAPLEYSGFESAPPGADPNVYGGFTPGSDLAGRSFDQLGTALSKTPIGPPARYIGDRLGEAGEAGEMTSRIVAGAAQTMPWPKNEKNKKRWLELAQQIARNTGKSPDDLEVRAAASGQLFDETHPEGSIGRVAAMALTDPFNLIGGIGIEGAIARNLAKGASKAKALGEFRAPAAAGVESQRIAAEAAEGARKADVLKGDYLTQKELATGENLGGRMTQFEQGDRVLYRTAPGSPAVEGTVRAVQQGDRIVVDWADGSRESVMANELEENLADFRPQRFDLGARVQLPDGRTGEIVTRPPGENPDLQHIMLDDGDVVVRRSTVLRPGPANSFPDNEHFTVGTSVRVGSETGTVTGGHPDSALREITFADGTTARHYVTDLRPNLPEPGAQRSTGYPDHMNQGARDAEITYPASGAARGNLGRDEFRRRYGANLGDEASSEGYPVRILSYDPAQDTILVRNLQTGTSEPDRWVRASELAITPRPDAARTAGREAKVAQTLHRPADMTRDDYLGPAGHGWERRVQGGGGQSASGSVNDYAQYGKNIDRSKTVPFHKDAEYEYGVVKSVAYDTAVLVFRKAGSTDPSDWTPGGAMGGIKSKGSTSHGIGKEIASRGVGRRFLVAAQRLFQSPYAYGGSYSGAGLRTRLAAHEYDVRARVREALGLPDMYRTKKMRSRKLIGPDEFVADDRTYLVEPPAQVLNDYPALQAMYEQGKFELVKDQRLAERGIVPIEAFRPDRTQAEQLRALADNWHLFTPKESGLVDRVAQFLRETEGSARVDLGATDIVDKVRGVPPKRTECGTCYQNAAEFLLSDISEPGDILVHGFPTLSRPPFKTFGHAWIERKVKFDPEQLKNVPEELRAMAEDSWEVIDPSSRGKDGRALSMPRELYYAIGRIDPKGAMKYDKDAAYAEMLRTKKYGSWADPPDGTMFADANGEYEQYGNVRRYVSGKWAGELKGPKRDVEVWRVQNGLPPYQVKATVPDEGAFTWKSQADQFPEKGPPGIGVQREDIGGKRFVDIVTKRDAQGRLEGILYHYPQDIPPYEKKGAVNVMVAPDSRRKGVATELLREGDRRYNIDFRKQKYTPGGAALVNEFLKAEAAIKEPPPAAVDWVSQLRQAADRPGSALRSMPGPPPLERAELWTGNAFVGGDGYAVVSNLPHEDLARIAGVKATGDVPMDRQPLKREMVASGAVRLSLDRHKLGFQFQQIPTREQQGWAEAMSEKALQDGRRFDWDHTAADGSVIASGRSLDSLSRHLGGKSVLDTTGLGALRRAMGEQGGALNFGKMGRDLGRFLREDSGDPTNLYLSAFKANDEVGKARYARQATGIEGAQTPFDTLEVIAMRRRKREVQLEMGIDETHTIPDDAPVSPTLLRQRAQIIRDRPNSLKAADVPGTPEEAAQFMEELAALADAGMLTRGQLRDKVAAKVFSLQPEPPQGKILDIWIGLPASGKSSVMRKLGTNAGRVVSADQGKFFLGEFLDGEGASIVHEESSLIKKMMEEWAIRRGDNISLTATGDNPLAIANRLARYRAAGYEVRTHYIEVDPSVAARRSVDRAMETGRLVEPEQILRLGLSNAPGNLYAKSGKGVADGWSRWYSPEGGEVRRVEAGGTLGRRRSAPDAGAAGEVPGARGGRAAALGEDRLGPLPTGSVVDEAGRGSSPTFGFGQFDVQAQEALAMMQEAVQIELEAARPVIGFAEQAASSGKPIWQLAAELPQAGAVSKPAAELRGQVNAILAGTADIRQKISDGVATPEDKARYAALLRIAALGRVREVGAVSEAARVTGGVRAPLAVGSGADITTKAIDDLFEAVIRGDTGKLDADIDKVVTALTEIGNDPRKVSALMRDLGTRLDFWDKFDEYYRANVLWGIPTHLTNMFSGLQQQALFFSREIGGAVADIPSIGLGAAGAEMRYLMTGYIYGYKEAFKSMPSALAGTMAHTSDKYGGIVRGGAIRPGDMWGLGKYVGPLVRTPFRFLAAEDLLQTMPMYNAAMGRRAVQQAWGEGVRGDALNARVTELLQQRPASISDEAFDIAERYALHGTTPFAQDISALRRANPAIRMMVLFVNTPVNLMRISASHSPMGFLRLMTENGRREWKDVTREATIGSGIMAGFAGMLASGDAMGMTPKSTGEQRAWEAEGRQALHIRASEYPLFGHLFRKLYGDEEATKRWVGPQFLGPLLIPYLMASAWHSINENQNPDPLADQIIVSAANAGRSMLDQIPLFSTYSMVARAAEVTNVDAALKLFGQFVTPVIPAASLGAMVNRLTDDFKRDPKTLDEILKTKIPFIAQEVRTKVDVLGLPLRGQPGDFGPRMTRERDDPLINESERLRIAQPDLWTGLQHVSKNIGDYELTYDQHHRYKELAGEERRKRLIELISDPKYQQMTSDKQAKKYREVDDDAKQAGRRRLGLEMAAAARTVDEVVQGADTAMIGTNYDKAAQVIALQQMGKLIPDVVAKLDGRRTVTQANAKGYELAVGDYLRGYQLVEAYKVAPAFVVGTPDEWARAEAAMFEYKPIYDAMRRDAEVKKVNIVQHRDYQSVLRMWADAGGGQLVRFYDKDGTPRDNLVSRERKTIKSDWLWGRFSSAVAPEPPN